MKRRADDQSAGRPRTIAEVLPEALAAAGLTEAVARAQAMAAWPTSVGARIAAVNEPRLLTDDGTLVVGVRTHGWMTELSLMEPQLLARLAGAAVTHPVRRLRWELLR
jgi:predicted nucleic acid-binding Zn ribbon protein